jgi:hypothetical protein
MRKEAMTKNEVSELITRLEHFVKEQGKKKSPWYEPERVNRQRVRSTLSHLYVAWADAEASYTNVEVQQATRHILMAAPELFEALRLLTEEGDPRGVVLAEQALAKARGEQL